MGSSSNNFFKKKILILGSWTFPLRILTHLGNEFESVWNFFPLHSKSVNEKLRCFDCRFQQQLQQVFRDFNATCIDLRIGDNCLKMTGYIAIYKISFSITIFFVTMFFITLGVTTSKGVRACIHNGFWLIKVSKKYMYLLGKTTSSQIKYG